MTLKLNWRDQENYSEANVDDFYISVQRHNDTPLYGVYIVEITKAGEIQIVSPKLKSHLFTDLEAAKKNALHELLGIFEVRANYYDTLFNQYGGSLELAT